MKTRFSSWYSFLFCIAVSGLSCGGTEAGVFCGKQSDCQSPGRPICSLAVCVGCGQDQDCKDNWNLRQQEAAASMMSMPVQPTVACEVSTGSCRECLTDAHCVEARPSDPLLRVCEPTAKACVGCVQNSDCAANAAAAADGLLTCDTTNKKCIDCTMPSDCNARPGMPYCVENRCSACDMDSHCNGVAGKPYCDKTGTSARKQCVSCTGQAADFCSKRSNGATPVCGANGTCAPCTKHEDCAATSGVCHRPGDYTPPTLVGSLTPGQCVPTDSVTNVTPSTIGSALTATDKQNSYLRLADGNYSDLTVGREVVLVGARTLDQGAPSAAKAVIGSVTVSGGRVTLYDLVLDRSASAAPKTLLKCSGGRVQLRLARLVNRSTEYGLDASSGCQEVRAAQSYFESDWQALLLSATSLSYSISNCIIVNSGVGGGPPFHANAVELGLTATGTFAHNTLYMNRQGIFCANSQVVANSVVTGTSASPLVGCTEQSVYKSSAGTADYTQAVTGVFRPSASIQANLKGKAMQVLNPAITVDLFGGARPNPTGSTADIGCEELP